MAGAGRQWGDVRRSRAVKMGVRKSACSMFGLHGAGGRDDPDREADRAPYATVEIAAMPTLLRFLTILALIGGAIYGGLFALATMVEPTQREMTVTVPPDRFHRAE